MPYIDRFTNRIFRGDCLHLLPRLPEESVDFVFTDPPYLVRYRDRQGRGIQGDDHDTWLHPAFAQVFRVLKPDRFCVSFYGWPRADQFLAAWRGAGFRPVGHLVWVKDYTTAERFLRYRHEQAYVLAKGDPQKPADLISDVLPWRYTGNILHPTQKPVTALLPPILALSRQDDIVLDPFCGSGSTLVAAKYLARRYVGVELDPEYCRIAQERLQRP